MNKLILFFALSIYSISFAQVDLVKQQAEINSAKGDLEDARKLRDQAVAERWADKKIQNEERESLAEKVRESKEKVDALAAERTRLFDEVRASREDLARIQAEAERVRNEFLTLSSQQDRAEPLGRLLDQGVPFLVPERLQQLNQLKKGIDLHRDDPGRVASDILKAAARELQYTRQVEWKDTDLLFAGDQVSRGTQVRLGAIGAVQFEPTQKRSALMLASAGEKGRVFGWQDNLGIPVKEGIGKAFFEARDSVAVLFPVDVLLSTSLSSQMAQSTELTWKDAFWKWMKDGGVLMYPIVGLGILALLLTMERMFVLLWKGRHSRRRMKQILKLAEEGKLDEAKAESLKVKGSLGKVVQAIFRHPEGGRPAAEKALEEVFSHEVPSLERRLGTISVFGTSAPLLGLLGTVMGMIQLFEIITLYGTNDPKLLAGGIAVALITTEGGLIVAIPVQLLHTWVSNRVEALTGEMETTALKLMNSIWIKG